MLCLLIADDEMIEQKMLHKTLQKNVGDRCIILQAENGREALKMYEEGEIQITILDIEMPGINGIETAQQIRKTDKECCIIFLTAYDESNYTKRAITVRALGYLLRPYDEQELMLVVEEAIRLASEYQANGILREELTGPPMPAGEEAEDGRQTRLFKVTEIINLYIKENYRLDISMQDLARHMNYSEAYFCKLFKQCFHKDFTVYLTEYRVEKAKGLLTQPIVNVKDIGKAAGCGDSNYFAKMFGCITGQSPTEYGLCIFQKIQR